MTEMTLGNLAEEKDEQKKMSPEELIEAAKKAHQNKKPQEINLLDPKIAQHNGIVHNVEYLKALNIEKILLDDGRGSNSYGITALVEGGTKDMELKERCPSVSTAVVENVIKTLLRGDYEKTFQFIKENEFESVDIWPLFYETDEAYQTSKKSAKMTILFKDGDVEKILLYNIESKFSFDKFLTAFEMLLEDGKMERITKMILQQFLMQMMQGQKGMNKSPGGIITP